jgi:hypothetical protein
VRLFLRSSYAFTDLVVLRIATQELTREQSFDRHELPNEAWLDLNHATICCQKDQCTRQKYPGGDAAVIGAILDPIFKTADLPSEQNCGCEGCVKRMPDKAYKAE